MKVQMRTLALLALACGSFACLGLLSPMAEPKGCDLGRSGACGNGTSPADPEADDQPMITVHSPLVEALRAVEKAQDAVQRGDTKTALSSLDEARMLIELEINSPKPPDPTDGAAPAVIPPDGSRYMVGLPGPAEGQQWSRLTAVRMNGNFTDSRGR